MANPVDLKNALISAAILVCIPFRRKGRAMTKSDNEQTAVLRAIDDMRRGLGFAVPQNGKIWLFVPIESLSADDFSALPVKDRSAIVTGARAKSLGLAKDQAAIAVDASALSYSEIKLLADPLAEPMELSYLSQHTAGEIDQLALVLAKHASLLPALLKIEADSDKGWQALSADDLRRYARNPIVDVAETARAKLPVEGAENATIASFRSHQGASTHLALIVGDVAAAKNPLVRVHSSCVTGDILGSLRCDCGDQLKLALAAIVKEGAGVLLYLHQEGRGIGITNKLRAYALQEKGVNTYDANVMLGFEEDERDFSIAAAILKKLGIAQLRLLSNNPYKITSLKACGIVVTDRVQLSAEAGKHNHAYLSTKKKSGHLF